MGIGSFVYNLVLLLHILCAIVGFGAVMLNGGSSTWCPSGGSASWGSAMA